MAVLLDPGTAGSLVEFVENRCQQVFRYRPRKTEVATTVEALKPIPEP